MKERPILFSAPMVQAILAGNKTQTRRVVKGFDIQGPSSIGHYDWFKNGKWEGAHKTSMSFSDSSAADNCPYGKIGDQLWVREKSRISSSGWHHTDGGWYCIDYAAGGSSMRNGDAPKHYPELSHNKDFSLRWQPSIHMPRWASRIQLEITNIRVERLQDISRADAIAEGIKRSGLTINGISEGDHFYDYEMKTEDMCEWYTNPIDSFQSLWNSINGTDSWTANPWVWVIEFKRVERPA